MDVRDRLRRHVRPWRGAGRTFRRDEQGGTAVQAIVMLPVILISMVLLMFLWQTMTIRRSLHTGTYLATRYLSLYTPENADQFYWADIAKKFIHAELRNNPWVDPNRLDLPTSTIEVSLPGGNECKADFTITARYPLMVPINEGDKTAFPFWEPSYYLEDSRRGKVLCSE
jgi:Flp pilus assembly protein TadG